MVEIIMNGIRYVLRPENLKKIKETLARKLEFTVSKLILPPASTWNLSASEAKCKHSINTDNPVNQDDLFDFYKVPQAVKRIPIPKLKTDVSSLAANGKI